MLVANGKASNMVFLVNDSDYLPLFESVQALGGNTYLTALDSNQKIHKKLANLADKYLTLDLELDQIFGVIRQPPQTEQQISQEEPIISTEANQELPTQTTE